MPYCAKCGVEVDDNIKKCPLCDFPIPDVGQEPDEQSINTFPEGENIYIDRVGVVKNKVFFILDIILIFTIPIFISIGVFYPSVTLNMNYIINCIIASIFYLFFLFNYLKTYYNILGIGLTSIILTYKLDSIDGNLSWFYNYSILIIILVVGILYLCLFLYRRNEKENKAIYILTYVFGSIGLLCLGIDSIISYRINNYIRPSWSIIVLISCIAICILIQGLYLGLPEKVRNKIKRKLHV
jgi:hypothetical protein